MDKSVLDNILEKHKAQPVGHGYIDIIVSRENYKDFVFDLVTHGFKIESISWWEWCANNTENNYGLGGPKSIFYEGWFSEIPVNVDDLNFPASADNNSIVKQILSAIENKTIPFSDETVKFSDSNWMTPAIWLDVPKDWRNKHSA
jgi:hypothetical protein